MYRREIDTSTREPGDNPRTAAGKALAVTLGPLALAMLALVALSWAFTDSASPQAPGPTGEPLAQAPSGGSSLSPQNNDAQDLSTYKFKDPMRQLLEPQSEGGVSTTPTAAPTGSSSSSGVPSSGGTSSGGSSGSAPSGSSGGGSPDDSGGGQGGGGSFEDDLRKREGDRFGDDQGGQSGGRGGDDGRRRGPGGMTSLPDSGGVLPGWLK